MDKEGVIHTHTYIHTHAHTHTTDYDTAVKENAISPFAVTRTGLENVLLSEVGQTKRDKYRIISLACGS